MGQNCFFLLGSTTTTQESVFFQTHTPSNVDSRIRLIVVLTMKIVLVSGIVRDTRLGTRRDRVSPCGTKAFPPYTSRVSFVTASGSAGSTMVDWAGCAASLSFDNEGPSGIMEIVLCVGGNGRVIGGSSWRAKKKA